VLFKCLGGKHALAAQIIAATAFAFGISPAAAFS